jgi:hypothetical protein
LDKNKKDFSEGINVAISFVFFAEPRFRSMRADLGLGHFLRPVYEPVGLN